MPERFKVVCIPCKALYKCSAFLRNLQVPQTSVFKLGDFDRCSLDPAALQLIVDNSNSHELLAGVSLWRHLLCQSQVIDG